MEVKLEIEINENKLKLTENEAKELYSKLHEMFGEKIYPIPFGGYFPIYPNQPNIIYGDSGTSTAIKNIEINYL